VRPLIDGHGHSGSPFRQALEHPTNPLAGDRYVCLGAQPHAVSRYQWLYAQRRGCVIRWCGEVHDDIAGSVFTDTFKQEGTRLAEMGCQVYVSIDADAVRMADVPAVSAPNPNGLSGQEVIAAARLAGRSPLVTSLDLVEINPALDRDGQSARWGALVIWNFLIGLLERQRRGAKK
jgi:formiminoglutamase